MDAIKKSILGYRSSDSRDTIPCILAMRMAFDKFKEFPGKALKFVADGYTAYKLAQQQFALHGMDFDVTQVIGLTNDDPVSTEYRWLKQIIERLNRTFKFSYKVTNRLWFRRWCQYSFVLICSLLQLFKTTFVHLLETIK